MRIRYVAAAALSLGLLAGCTSESDEPGDGGSPTVAESPEPSQGSSAPSGSASATDQAPSPSGKPGPASPTTALLDWTPIHGSTDDLITHTEHGDLVLAENGPQVQVRDAEIKAPRGYFFVDLLTDGTYAVAIALDKQETKPSQATVTDLRTGKQSTLDGSSDVPTINGGSWAVADGHVWHPTYDAKGRYCVADVDLATGKGALAYCAPKQSGYAALTNTPTGTSLMTFTGQPQCRTLQRLDGSTVSKIEGPTGCAGWDSALTPTGAVWSVVPDANRIDSAVFYARDAAGTHELGPGSSGSLVWCGDSVYFSRDAQLDKGKARVLRWTPEGTLEVVYESPGSGQAFLSEPRCSGNLLSVSAFGEGGDEQVWATVPG